MTIVRGGLECGGPCPPYTKETADCMDSADEEVCLFIRVIRPIRGFLYFTPYESGGGRAAPAIWPSIAVCKLPPRLANTWRN